MTEVLLGDSKELLKELPDDSIDALVTDPPYLINFMGKDWDKENSPAGDKDFWALVLSKMKPGAHGLVFGHSRQHHRVMTALEDAGWEVRDCLMWLYGSGFPKSHNVGKAVDKLEGNERKVIGEKTHARKGVAVAETRTTTGAGAYGEERTADITTGNSEWEGWGTALKPAYEPIILVRRPIEKKLTVAKNVLKHGVGGINIDASRIGTDEDFSNVKPRQIQKLNSLSHDENSESWKAAKDKLQNLGRFPANVILSHHPDCEEVGVMNESVAKNVSFKDTKQSDAGWGTKKCNTEKVELATPIYDCVDDCPVKILDEQSGTTKSSDNKWKGDNNSPIYGKYESGIRQATYSDKGGASRFFYNAKVSKKERNRGIEDLDETTVGDGRTKPIDNAFQRGKTLRKNTHPTVKPIALMKYLIKLITPKGGTVLDPFTGSGSTGMAAVALGNEFIGMEMDEEYCKIAELRIQHSINESIKSADVNEE